MELGSKLLVHPALLHRHRFRGRIKRRSLERRDLAGDFDEVVQSPHHQLHFVGLRALLNREMEMRYGQTLLLPAFCAQPVEQREQCLVVYTQLDEQYKSNTARLCPR